MTESTSLSRPTYPPQRRQKVRIVALSPNGTFSPFIAAGLVAIETMPILSRARQNSRKIRRNSETSNDLIVAQRARLEGCTIKRFERLARIVIDERVHSSRGALCRVRRVNGHTKWEKSCVRGWSVYSGITIYPQIRQLWHVRDQYPCQAS